MYGLCRSNKWTKTNAGAPRLAASQRRAAPSTERAIAPVPDAQLVAARTAEEHRAGDGRESLEVERAVVQVEALVEPHLAFQEHAANERRRLVAMRVQHRRQRDRARRNALGILLDLILETDKWK